MKKPSKVFFTRHAHQRIRERGLLFGPIKNAVRKMDNALTEVPLSFSYSGINLVAKKNKAKIILITAWSDEERISA